MSSAENKSDPVFEVYLPAHALFAVPGLIGPNPHFALPDLVFQLARVNRLVIYGVGWDIFRRRYKLSPAELSRLAADADVQASHPHLYEFALKELALSGSRQS